MLSSTFLASLAMAQVAFSFNCSIAPIYVDMHKRAVHDSEPFQYGAFIGYGSPAQNFSLWPSFTHNETTFATDDFCTADSPANCADNTHGTFSSDLSRTWKPIPTYQPLDVDDHNTSTLSIQYGEDTMDLYTHFFETDPAVATTCYNFSSSLLSNSTSSNTSFFGPQGVLGLGQSSTNLQQLYANNVIASRSLGLYLGTGYDRAGGNINGSLTYGGFDSGRFTEPVHNYTLAPVVASPDQSPLTVHVSQISLNFPDQGGDSINLINDTGFDAQISTSQYPLTLPRSVTQFFAKVLSATPANNFDNSLKLNRPFSGNLTITLSDGFTVSFPPEWVANISSLTPISATPLSSSSESSDADDNGPFILGASFLTQVYLAVNYDSTPPAFHLAPAVLRNAIGVMPQTFCPNTAPSPYTPPHLSHFVKAGLVGAIIGGVIGGSALTLLAWAIVRSCLRRHERKKRQVRFAVGKVMDVESGEEMEEQPIAMKGRTMFTFRPPMTPGQPVTPGQQAARTEFPFPTVREQQGTSFKGPTERITVVTTFDPPPRVAIMEKGQKQKKGSRWRRN